MTDTRKVIETKRFIVEIEQMSSDDHVQIWIRHPTTRKILFSQNVMSDEKLGRVWVSSNEHIDIFGEDKSK